MNAVKLITVIALLAVSLIPALGATGPDKVVSAYIDAFKQKNKDKILESLSDSFFVDYKTQYLRTIEAYSADKQKLLLRMFEIGTLDELRSMSGRSIFSTFLDKPASESYWKGFDSLDLVIEVETVEIKQDQAVVKSWLSRKGGLGLKVETTYSLKKSPTGWKIERFHKRRIEPNKAPEPTP